MHATASVPIHNSHRKTASNQLDKPRNPRRIMYSWLFMNDHAWLIIYNYDILWYIMIIMHDIANICELLRFCYPQGALEQLWRLLGHQLAWKPQHKWRCYGLQSVSMGGFVGLWDDSWKWRSAGPHLIVSYHVLWSHVVDKTLSCKLPQRVTTCHHLT